MNIAGEKVVVVGLGKSGIAASGLLKRLGARVVATDAMAKDDLRSITSPEIKGIELVLGKHPPEILADASLVVVSPGVPDTIPFLHEARRRGMQIWSEVELASRFCKAPILAVTGANGKTTTSAWLGEMLAAAGKEVVVAGNIGIPLSSIVEKVTAAHLIVAEISSFQLENIRDFHPWMAALLNVTADHLDRHGSFAAYLAAKGRLFTNQGPDDYSVLNADDEQVGRLSEKVRSRIYWFSNRKVLSRGAFIRNGFLTIQTERDCHKLCKVEELALPGEHNRENALAAALMAYLAGAPIRAISSVLRNFAGVAHRCENVAEIVGIRFINDSKGTNPEATIRALQAFTPPIILIAGGRAKGSDFTELAGVIKKRVKKVILLGEAASQLREKLFKVGYQSVLEVPSLGAAVGKAFAEAVPGDCILLSPACASWDMFTSFEERGEVFKEAVAQLGRRADEKKAQCP